MNTADSRVELSVVPAELPWPDAMLAMVIERLAPRLVGGTLTIAASEHRQQIRNREAARARLASMLREAVAPLGPQRRPTRPTAGSRRRRLEAKRHRSQIKQGRRGWSE